MRASARTATACDRSAGDGLLIFDAEVFQDVTVCDEPLGKGNSERPGAGFGIVNHHDHLQVGWPKSRRWNRSTTRRASLWPCPSRSSHVLSFNPCVSTTRRSPSHLPAEYPSHVGVGSFGCFRLSRCI